jgi:hypothetical protein
MPASGEGRTRSLLADAVQRDHDPERPPPRRARPSRSHARDRVAGLGERAVTSRAGVGSRSSGPRRGWKAKETRLPTRATTRLPGFSASGDILAGLWEARSEPPPFGGETRLHWRGRGRGEAAEDGKARWRGGPRGAPARVGEDDRAIRGSPGLKAPPPRPATGGELRTKARRRARSSRRHLSRPLAWTWREADEASTGPARPGGGRQRSLSGRVDQHQAHVGRPVRRLPEGLTLSPARASRTCPGT